MSNPLNNECVTVAVKEIEAAGRLPKVEFRGKHLAVVWEQAGSLKTYIVPSSPSDRRAWLNCRADVRRILRPVEDKGAAIAFMPNLTAKNGEVVASSKDVASAFEKRHDHVLRDIDNLLKNMDSPECAMGMFWPAMEADGSGIARRVYHISRDGFALIAMGFTGSKALRFKLAYIQAFNAMEGAIAKERERQAVTSAAGEVRRLEADLVALTDLVLEQGTAQSRPARRPPFIRPSVLRRQRMEARRA
ncbi:Rha family transcriptional regulator [Methylopila sp. 73B]|uniref:Rha family transcriptional regulator n=1 Tax=Methylopila sp. 73B TaxID=1120792 RepID=UPI000377D97D|nr:Rha family transcriptional regulator [Methylopila sp. 73B]